MHREFQPSQMAFGHTHASDHDHHDHDAELRWLIFTTALVGVLLGLDLILGFWGSDYRRPFGVPLALAAAVIGGGRVVYLALAALLEGRIGADIALAVACVAAGILGEYFVAAEVVFIALVGECLEAFTFERAQRAIHALLEHRPQTARVIRDGQEVEVEADAVFVGETMIVRPGERIAADGLVTAGRSAVDQAVLTGESLPVDKGDGDPVYTGTVNQFGRLEIRVDKVGAETTLGQVIRLLADAQSRKSPLERTADKYARRFLPAVLTAAAVVFFATNAGGLWRWGRLGTVPAIDLMPALAVLVVACPCALVLATPAAVLAATARLARRGVLVKGGAAIERLASVDAVAFDKTGTLTEGRPELGDRIVVDPAWDVDRLLQLAASVEKPSEHPLGRLVVNEAERVGLNLFDAEDFQAHPGAGISARVRFNDSPHEVLVGNLRICRERGVGIGPELEKAVQTLDDSGQTALLVAVDGRAVGALGARDRVRREAHEVIHDLENLGLRDLTILTGDRPAPARLVAKKVHVKQFESELTPAAKADWIQRRQHEGRVVAMVGDGINDAPALAIADVGLAIGGVGANLAAEAGSIVLMGAPLEALPGAIRLARQTVRVIHQNILIFAFGLNGVAIVLAGLRLLGPVAAAIFHQIGSLLVLLNAIRLLGFERWSELPGVHAAEQFAVVCRRCRPSVMGDWAWHNRRTVVRGLVGLAVLAYLASGLTRIDPEQLGILRRGGRYRPPLLEPGLHVRLPIPFETVTKTEPERVRVARVGSTTAAGGPRGPIAWSAVHGARRDEGALFFTGDENLVEVAAVVEYRYTREAVAELIFQVNDAEQAVAAAAEGVFREEVGRTPLESILVAKRGDFEAEVEHRLRKRLVSAGLPVAIDRVRVVDAHPPREVVPAYRDVSAAVSDAERYRNEALAIAAEQHWTGLAEAKSRRDSASALSHQLRARAEGDRGAFVARQSAHAARPSLSEFRLLWDTMAEAFAGRPKLILDRRAKGRRHVWLADPDSLGLGRALAPIPAAIANPEPED